MKPMTKFALVFIITLIFGTVAVVTTTAKKTNEVTIQK